VKKTRQNKLIRFQAKLAPVRVKKTRQSKPTGSSEVPLRTSIAATNMGEERERLAR
jgi:hypothetical protein